MKWTIQEIKEASNGILQFDEFLNIRAAVQERDRSILDIDPVHVSGYVAEMEGEYLLHAELKANLTLPSTRSLKPVTINLATPIRERYVYSASPEMLDESEEVVLELTEDAIDLDSAVIDAILVNKPIQVLAEDEIDGELPSGEDWEVLTEEDFMRQKAEEIDPRFEALKDLLKEDDLQDEE